MVDITLVVVVLVVWPTISAAAATFCVFCVRRFGASFLWRFDAILLSHRSVGHFRVVSGSHKFRHVGHFVACWDINSMPMSNVVASYNFALLRLPIVVACPLLLLLPLVAVASCCCCCLRCYLGFLLPGLSVSVSVWEHNLFALVFAAQETSLLSQADWKSTHPHTHTDTLIAGALLCMFFQFRVVATTTTTTKHNSKCSTSYGSSSSSRGNTSRAALTIGKVATFWCCMCAQASLSVRVCVCVCICLCG